MSEFSSFFYKTQYNIEYIELILQTSYRKAVQTHEIVLSGCSIGCAIT